MKLQTKDYKYLKIKKYLKSSNFLLIYNETSIKNFVEKNQKLKKLKLQCYKSYNTLTKKIFKKSIYKNFQPVINGLTTIITLNKKISYLSFNNFFNLNESLYLTGLKLNNKIYPVSKIQPSLPLNYRSNHLIFIKFLKTRLKITHKLR